MAEYIEREAALKTLEKSLLFCESELETGEYRKGCIAAIQDDIGNIKHLPTADVVEVKHGEWGHKYSLHKIVCLNCGTPRPYQKIKRGYHLAWNSNYCPNCGAKMDGATDTSVGGKLKKGAEE